MSPTTTSKVLCSIELTSYRPVNDMTNWLPGRKRTRSESRERAEDEKREARIRDRLRKSSSLDGCALLIQMFGGVSLH